MKSYTDIEQSRKLAEILPHESADMVYIWQTASYNPASYNPASYNPALRFDEDMPPIVLKDALKDIPTNKITVDILPCWNLAALLNVINKTYYVTLLHDGVMWNILVIHHDIDKCNHTIHADNPVDACVAMIELLRELKML